MVVSGQSVRWVRWGDTHGDSYNVLSIADRVALSPPPHHAPATVVVVVFYVRTGVVGGNAALFEFCN